MAEKVIYIFNLHQNKNRLSESCQYKQMVIYSMNIKAVNMIVLVFSFFEQSTRHFEQEYNLICLYRNWEAYAHYTVSHYIRISVRESIYLVVVKGLARYHLSNEWPIASWHRGKRVFLCVCVCSYKCEQAPAEEAIHKMVYATCHMSVCIPIYGTLIYYDIPLLDARVYCFNNMYSIMI